MSIEIEHTLAIIKPDLLNQSPSIRQIIRSQGFVVVQENVVHLRVEQCSEFYSEHIGKSFYPSVVSYLASGPIEVMVLAKINAVEAWRELMGSTDPTKAEEEEPDSLRTMFGTSVKFNGFHGSDSVSSAEREIHFFFRNAMLRPLSPEESKEYLAKFVNPVLSEALAEVTRRKPVDPLLFLIEYLEANNPSKPRVETASAN